MIRVPVTIGLTATWMCLAACVPEVCSGQVPRSYPLDVMTAQNKLTLAVDTLKGRSRDQMVPLVLTYVRSTVPWVVDNMLHYVLDGESLDAKQRAAILREMRNIISEDAKARTDDNDLRYVYVTRLRVAAVCAEVAEDSESFAACALAGILSRNANVARQAHWYLYSVAKHLGEANSRPPAIGLGMLEETKRPGLEAAVERWTEWVATDSGKKALAEAFRARAEARKQDAKEQDLGKGQGQE